jgi:hypothetical protein
MASPQWRDQLQQALRRQGLPSVYISRLVEELTDHATDISQENSSMDAEQTAASRLGRPEHLASIAKTEFNGRTFAGRHPLVTFIAGPIVAIPCTLAMIFLVAFGCMRMIDTAMGGSFSANDELGLPPTSMEVAVIQAFNGFVRFAPFAFSAWLFMRLGGRAGLRIWPAAACGIIALLALFFVSVVTPATADGPGMLMIGFGWKFVLDQALQAAMPLALGGWFLCRHSTSRSQAIAA